jgi:amino acid transporter/mannitol/fructose-specific phosphotransferase system IIA component (Ntr-type)
MGTGAMISSGLFILPALAFSEAGILILPAYFLAGICMLPAIFTKLELTSAIPRAGGAFFYLTRILGAPAGLIAGFFDWFSISLKSAFALIGIGLFGSLLFPEMGTSEFKLIAVGAALFFTVLNIISVKSTGRFQVLMVVFLLLIIAAYIIIGYRRMDFSHFHTTGLPENPLLTVFTTAGMVFVSYGGITKIATAVEEIEDPKRMLIKGMISAFVAVQIIYLLAIFITIGVMRPDMLARSNAPLSDAGALLFDSTALSNIAVIGLSAAGLLAFFTTANAGILAASRVPFGMSRDGMLPQTFGKETRQGTPLWSVIFTSLFMILVILFLDPKDLAKTASLFLLFVFLMENIGLLIIRLSKISHYRPAFHSPAFPIIQIFGILIYSILIITQGLIPLIICGICIVLSILWYFFYARIGWSRTSAFISMVRKNFQAAYTESTNDLEDELLSILIEREKITEDRFDKIIRNAAILDYQNTMTRDEVFHDIARILADRHNIDEHSVFKKLCTREAEASTLIYPGVAVPHAIPHVIIEGSSLFDLVLVRSKFGIRWTNNEVVYTVFCLAGTKDERNFHLQALMSIAQILQNPEFSESWHKARNERELKAAVILLERKRFN